MGSGCESGGVGGSGGVGVLGGLHSGVMLGSNSSSRWLQPLNLSPESLGHEFLPCPEAARSVHNSPEIIEVGLHGLDFILEKSVLS